MPEPIVHDHHRGIAARIVGSMSDDVLANLLRTDIAREIALAELRGPDAISGEDALVRELLPVLRELPSADTVRPTLDDVAHPAQLISWLRGYRSFVEGQLERARRDAEDARELYRQRAAVRAFLGLG